MPRRGAIAAQGCARDERSDRDGARRPRPCFGRRHREVRIVDRGDEAHLKLHSRVALERNVVLEDQADEGSLRGGLRRLVPEAVEDDEPGCRIDIVLAA